MQTLSHSIGGAAHRGPPALNQRNPSRLDEVVCELPAAGDDLVERAVDAAKRAQPALRDAGIEWRADLLDRCAQLLLARQSVLARLIARETGKTITDAGGEVARAARICRFFGGEALRIVGEQFESTRPGVRIEVSYEPVGLVAAVTPWNFPIAIPVWKIAPALAFGNTVVWKPSEHSSATASALMQVFIDAGLPAGAVNMLLGAGDTGAALAMASGIDAISFTGSGVSGMKVKTACAERFVRIQLELGGVNGHLILADADLPKAADTVVNAAYFAAGQRCTATSRIIAEDAIADAVIELIGHRVSGLKRGDPELADTQLGPLVSPRQKEAVLAGIDAMRKLGRPTPIASGDFSAADCFVEPVLFDQVQPDDPLCAAEIFGPVAGLIRVKDYEAGLAALSSSPFGLSAGLSTSSLKHAEHFKRAAPAGMVMINLPTAGVDYHAPFGGARVSSFGPREQGRAAREFFTASRTTYQSS